MCAPEGLAFRQGEGFAPPAQFKTKDYSLFLMIFPLMVLGRSLRNSTMRGYL